MKNDKRNKAVYGKFYQTSTGELFGETEHSFSMGCSGIRVVIFPMAKGKRDLTLASKKYPCKMRTDEGEIITVTRAFFLRLSRKDCPIVISLDERNAMRSKATAWDKYLWRNVPFFKTGELLSEVKI